MNHNHTYIIGTTIMLLAALSHGIFNEFSSPIAGIFSEIQIFGLAVVLTTAALESNILEYKQEEAE